jgi:hypothetical protein
VTRFALLAVCLAGCSVDDGGSSCIAGSSDLCTGDNVCMGSTCAAAFPHDYAITNLSVTAPNLKPDGMPWDPDEDGSPDLYVDISVNGTIITTTDIIMNTYNASYAGPYMVSLTSGATLDLATSDSDGATSEPVYDCPIPVSASILRVRFVLCSGTGVTINYTIDPT